MVSYLAVASTFAHCDQSQCGSKSPKVGVLSWCNEASHRASALLPLRRVHEFQGREAVGGIYFLFTPPISKGARHTRWPLRSSHLHQARMRLASGSSRSPARRICAGSSWAAACGPIAPRKACSRATSSLRGQASCPVHGVHPSLARRTQRPGSSTCITFS
jgi:hypothetical protein